MRASRALRSAAAIPLEQRSLERTDPVWLVPGDADELRLGLDEPATRVTITWDKR